MGNSIEIDAILFSAKQVSNTSWQLMVRTLAFVLFVWLLKYHWGRRYLYYYASKIQNGPFNLPIIGAAYLFLGDTHEVFNSMLKLYHKYPRIFKVWLANNLFIGVSRPEYVEIIMNSPKALARPDVFKFTKHIFGDGIFIAPVPLWKKTRKMINPTFNQKILDSFVDVFSEQCQNFVSELKKYVGKKNIDLFDLVSKCTLDIICETAMGIQIEAQKNNIQFGKWLDRAFEISFLRMSSIYYHSDLIFNLSPVKKEQDKIAAKMENFVGKVVSGKKKLFEEKLKHARDNADAQIEEVTLKRKAFLDLLLELSYEGVKLNENQLRDEVMSFIIAGSDTTATINSFIFTMLAMHPHIQEKVYNEAINILGPDREVEYTDLSKFKYIEMVIKETMRLFPIGPTVGRDVEADISLGGYTIPAGCSIGIGVLYIHRSEEYWKEPLKFMPERFLPEEVEKRHPYCYMPFSMGARNCIGRTYAMMAMKAMVATLSRKFRFFTEYKSVGEIELKTNFLIRPRDGFKFSLELRE